MEKSSVFAETIGAYLEQMQGCDFRLLQESLGIRAQQDLAEVMLLGRSYRVSAKGIFGQDGRTAHAAVAVILSKYILMCPRLPPPEAEWRSFKDFRNAAPLVASFANTVEAVIAREFSGQSEALRQAAEKLGGRPPVERYPYDLSLLIPALPKVPLLLFFNDADKEFAAAARVLFERRAERYLDMECLVMLGMLFADCIRRSKAEPVRVIPGGDT
jgi:hypothetical protein